MDSKLIKIENNVKDTKKKDKIKKPSRIFWAIIGVLCTFAVMTFMILALYGPEEASNFYSVLWKSNFGNQYVLGSLMAALSWMMFAGLAMLVGFRGGVFNLAISGQMMAAGLTGFLFSAFINVGPIGPFFSILVPALTGMLIALLIGWLKVKFQIHEVISSLLINWGIFWTYKYVVNIGNTPWIFPGGGSQETIQILPSNSLQFGFLADLLPGTGMNIMFMFGIIAICLLAFMYLKTKWGKKQDLLGTAGANVSKYAGLSRNKEIYKTLLISGLLAGLAGSAYYLGVNQRLPIYTLETPSSDLFLGTTIALIGFLEPIGVFFSALLLSMIYNSQAAMSSFINIYLLNFTTGVLFIFISIVNYFIIFQPQARWKLWYKKLILRKNSANRYDKDYDDSVVDLNKLISQKVNLVDKDKPKNDYEKKYKKEKK